MVRLFPVPFETDDCNIFEVNLYFAVYVGDGSFLYDEFHSTAFVGFYDECCDFLDSYVYCDEE